MARCCAQLRLLVDDLRKLFVGKTAGKRLFKKVALLLVEPRGKIKMGKTNGQYIAFMEQGKGFQPVSPVVGILQRQYVPQLVFQHSVRGLSRGLWITVPFRLCANADRFFRQGQRALLAGFGAVHAMKEQRTWVA